MTYTRTILFVPYICALACVPLLAKATTVTNSFSVSATTGGNNASGGTVHVGSQESSVDLETYVDGVQVTDIHEYRTNGKPLVVHRTVTATSSVSTVRASSTASANNDTLQHEQPRAIERTNVPTPATDTPRKQEGERPHFTNVISITNPWNGTFATRATGGEDTLAPSLLSRLAERLSHTLEYVASHFFF